MRPDAKPWQIPIPFTVVLEIYIMNNKFVVEDLQNLTCIKKNLIFGFFDDIG